MTSPLNDIAMTSTAVNVYAVTHAKKRRMSSKRMKNFARYAATMQMLVNGAAIQAWFHPDAVENYRYEVQR